MTPAAAPIALTISQLRRMAMRSPISTHSATSSIAARCTTALTARKLARAALTNVAIDVARNGINGRGVLLDIPKIKRVEWLEPGEPIFPEDLDAAERDHQVTTGEGDILFIRTGRARRRKIKGAWNTMRDGMPGLDASCLRWLHERKIALLGSDSTSDCVPSGYDRLMRPIHTGTLVMMGVHLIDNADLDALAVTAERLGRYAFQLTIAPLILTRGTASPVNPLALF